MILELRVVLSMVALLVGTLRARAERRLGALLDAGAMPLSPRAFKEELVLRMIAGPTPTGGKLEVMYTTRRRRSRERGRPHT